MIKINGIRWRLVKVSPSNPALQTPKGNLALGCCDSTNHTIYIRKDLHDKKLKEVLLHEMTHAVIYSYDIQLTTTEEENIASIISSSGLEIIKLTQQALEQKQED